MTLDISSADSAENRRQTQTAAFLRATAAELGLAHIAFTSASEIAQYALYKAWLDADYAGELVYLYMMVEMRCVLVWYLRRTLWQAPILRLAFVGESFGRELGCFRDTDSHLFAVPALPFSALFPRVL